MKTEQYVLEWNHASNSFHIQPLADSLAWAQKCFMEDRENVWPVIMVGSKDAVHSLANSQRPRLVERSLKDLANVLAA